MALQTAYKQFLAAPSSDALAANASLNYITTTTAYNGPTEIMKHFASQQKQIKKKKEEFLSAVEGKDSIAVEVETSLQFLTSGGAYLPALDDNFLADRTVFLAVIHIVSFGPDGKILRIRQSWDQGSLLKQIEVIGKTGRNWPIRDSTEQIKMITNSVQGAAGAPAAAVDPIARSRGNSTNVLRDPHASLSLFPSREELEAAGPSSVVSPFAGPRHRQRDFSEMISEAGEDTPRAVVSPYAGTRPAQRSFHDIVSVEAEGAQSPSAGRERSDSPSKAVAPKIGAGKNFQPSRLFDTEAEVDNDTPEKKVDRFYRPHATKYNHFDFADGSDPQDAPKPGHTVDKAPKSKHDSTWSFEDFTTPSKPRTAKIPAQAVRHWGTEDDEIPESPGKNPVQVKPRRDAETHFEFQDDGVPSGEPRATGRPRGHTHNEGLGLYENNLYNEDGSAPANQDPRALGNITNVKDRRKDFDAHFTMTDDSPHHATTPQGKQASDRKKAVKMMEANWAAYDKSPSQKENKQDNRGINTAGDGMGGRKGGRGWSLGDDGEEEKNAEPRKVKVGAGYIKSDIWDF